MGKTYKDQQGWERKQMRPRCSSCGKQIDGRVFYREEAMRLPVCERCNEEIEESGYGHGV